MKLLKNKNKNKKQRSLPYRKYSNRQYFVKLFSFFKWKIIDLINVIKYGREFNEYGLTMYTGKQGAGKTIAMTEYLERMRHKYPKALIITNFGYIHEHKEMGSWQDFFDIRNGTDGVIFAIDEIQNEFNSTSWKTFPETLLSEITQQRKQRVKIVATSQVFTRVVKQLREQTLEVVECKTLFGRWTIAKAYDADEYNAVMDNPEKKMKLFRAWRKSFIQDINIRNLYDSYAKIERMKRTEFLPRSERLSNDN